MDRAIVDMKNSNALITKAMLASYLNERRVDYLDMISPFVLRALPEQIDSIINIAEVTKKVKNEYGLNINQKTIEKILTRLCKNKSGNIVRRETKDNGLPGNKEIKKSYYVNKKIEHEEFDKRKDKIKKSVDEVVTRLRDYINENYQIIISITYEQAQEYFLTFLKNYNYDLYSNVDNLREIQGIEKNNSNNYRVAKFILHEYSLKDGCFEKIKEIQEGFFASTAIYYFCNSTNSDNPIKMIDGTKVFLDTRLLIDVLELNQESEAKSMGELISLIKKHGGQLCTFDYYVDEVIGIVHRYLVDKKSRNLLDLEYFRRRRSNDIEIALFEKTIKKTLIDKGVEIIDNFEFGNQIKEQTWHIDSLELRKNMRSLINYSGGESAQAFINDSTTLERISFYKTSNVNFKTQKAIFVTSNYGIIKAAEKTFTDPIFQDDIEIVISDIDLAAFLWLSNYNPSSNLSNLILLENAYAAICPSKEVLNEVIRIIEECENDPDEKIRNEALLLRGNKFLREDIAEITQNNKENCDETILSKLFVKLEEHTRDELYDETYNKAYKDAYIEAKKQATQDVKERVEKELKQKINEIAFHEQEAKEQKDRADESDKLVTEERVKKEKAVQDAEFWKNEAIELKKMERS